MGSSRQLCLVRALYSRFPAPVGCHRINMRRVFANSAFLHALPIVFLIFIIYARCDALPNTPARCKPRLCSLFPLSTTLVAMGLPAWCTCLHLAPRPQGLSIATCWRLALQKKSTASASPTGSLTARYTTSAIHGLRATLIVDRKTTCRRSSRRPLGFALAVLAGIPSWEPIRSRTAAWSM
jgi:hypothetical protein